MALTIPLEGPDRQVWLLSQSRHIQSSYDLWVRWDSKLHNLKFSYESLLRACRYVDRDLEDLSGPVFNLINQAKSKRRQAWRALLNAVRNQI